MPEAKPLPARRRRWIDALVETALRWNDRLSRPVGTHVEDSSGAAAGVRVASGPEPRPGTAPAK
jgi:hypothetical protein